ncbi:flagellar protein FliS [Aneurinibacillus tyrosinisolvens]|uniref:flagellar protein FliS n=1 Tax=Aneurinibacillus tyrosinisolvens TaxID=1443435 RepID=UPI000699B9A8|nr:flagellar protein FliS [Aneurinibacillus tyrosinisolvens]
MESTLTPQNVELSDIHDKPELITSLLYKKLLQKLDAAIMLLPQRRYLEANRAMQYCNDIVTRLGFGIKYEAGVMADQLELLYRYLFDQIHEANMKKDIQMLKEVRRIVRELDSVWTLAMNQAQAGTLNEEDKNMPVSTTGIRPGAPRFNPYQQREMEQEVYQYEQEKQEIHLKK